MNKGSLNWLRFFMIALLLFITFAVSWNLVADIKTANLKKQSQNLTIENLHLLSSQSFLPIENRNGEEILTKSEGNFGNTASNEEFPTKEDKKLIQKADALALKSNSSDLEIQVSEVFEENKITPRENQRNEASYPSGLIASLSDVIGYSIPLESEFPFGKKEEGFLAGISHSQSTSENRENFEEESSSIESPKAARSQEPEKGLVIESSQEDGIKVEDALHNGVNIVKAHRGLNVRHAYGEGMNVNFTHNDGFNLDSADVNGVDIDHVGDDGIQIFRAGKDGLVIYNAAEEGIDAIGDRGNLLRSNSPDFYGLYVYSYGASPSNSGLYVAGTFYATGTKSSVVQTSRGDEVLYAVESPEVEFVVSGTGKLVNGQCFVTFDRLFQESISKEIPLRIILTPKDTWSGLYVAEKSHQGFQVKAVDGEKDAEFDWLAIGRRKGYEKRPDSPFLKGSLER